VRYAKGQRRPINARDIRVLQMMANDLNGPDIARILAINVNTFNKIRAAIYERLNVVGAQGAVLKAVALGLIVNPYIEELEIEAGAE